MVNYCTVPSTINNLPVFVLYYCVVRNTKNTKEHRRTHHRCSVPHIQHYSILYCELQYYPVLNHHTVHTVPCKVLIFAYSVLYNILQYTVHQYSAQYSTYCTKVWYSRLRRRTVIATSTVQHAFTKQFTIQWTRYRMVQYIIFYSLLDGANEVFDLKTTVVVQFAVFTFDLSFVQNHPWFG